MTPEKMTDAEIVKELAEDVMGWSGTSIPGVWHIGTGLGLRRFDPLLDGNDRDMLVDAMREKGWQVVLIVNPDEPWSAQFEHPQKDVLTCEFADTPGRAVALAALKAIRAEKETGQ